MRWRHCGVKVKELPPLVNEQVNEFPAQINEIEHGYRQLTTAHYVFTDDIPGMVEDVNERWLTLTPRLSRLMWTPQKRLTAKLKLRLIRCTRLWKGNAG